ncbi:hypothetical protein BIY29_18765 [Brenneria alni]|uniref:DNA lyase n=1 Tax=Brenneria alni TaxID=71656 RepID=A0A421DIZ9_9GAMM|nr:hypothetical protein [Brenneria alni]RLM18007.1 hypothetical protein BIY29_18765 [Brenneria alni]
MNYSIPKHDPFDLLIFARKIANQAHSEGIVTLNKTMMRACQSHMGAIVADSVLQAGVNYRAVVLPRINNILTNFSEFDTLSKLLSIIDESMIGLFLQWKHETKIERFKSVVLFLKDECIESQIDLRECLLTEKFRNNFQKINGVGPKTIDYMSCLIGLNSIAVDRHIRSFAVRAGVKTKDYDFLKNVFCYAADLLKISRRDFDSWVWQQESERFSAQLPLAI